MISDPARTAGTEQTVVSGAHRPRFRVPLLLLP
jgi:hypothetical protein